MNLSSHPAIENKRYSQELKKIHKRNEKKVYVKKKKQKKETHQYMLSVYC